MSEAPLPTFASLGLSGPLLRAVAEREYSTPTPIQLAAIPAVLRGRDLWATAQTGSGKTAAFALPVLEVLQAQRAARASRSRGVQALVLVPTRELALQVGSAFRTWARFYAATPRIEVVVGGVSINPQMMALRGGADVVVATPGRLLDLVERNALSLGTTGILVLDEADRLYALGFADELKRVLGLLPATRQNLLFSATFPADVQALAEGMLRDPLRIEIASTPVTAPAIRQRAIEVDEPRRTQLLRRLIENEGWTRVLVFVATKYATEHVAEKLRRAGLAAGALHGELSQGARTAALADFKSGDLRVLVATDLAARGLDIVDLPVVVNYDLPRSTDDYVHRIGRTGRAGASGLAVSFVTVRSHAHFRLIERRHQLSVPREQVPGFEPVELAAPEAPATGGVKGRRKSKKDKLREAAARAAQSASPDQPRQEPPKTFSPRPPDASRRDRRA